MTQTIDLSHAGVDRILAALAADGIEVHYSETDGDTAIDVWLTDVELADGMPATVLSWRDTEGWLLRHWEEFHGDTNTQTPDGKWRISAGSVAEVARDVASILDESEPEAERPGLTAGQGETTGPMTTQPISPAEVLLTDDPATVALLRDLYAHARTIGARHLIYGWGGLTGGVGEWEHTWIAGSDRVTVDAGQLIYKRGGTVLLRVDVGSVREAAHLLAAIGVLPERFVGGAR